MPLLLDAFKKVNIGDPMHKQNLMGAHVTKQHFERIMAYIEKAKAGGAKVAIGGARHGSKGYFIEPTLFTDVSLGKSEVILFFLYLCSISCGTDNVAGKEEIFGAVGCVFKFKDEADAIKIANDTVYGLAAGVHSSDAKQLRRVVRRLKAVSASTQSSVKALVDMFLKGTVWENSFVNSSIQAPFGGYKGSGWGREWVDLVEEQTCVLTDVMRLDLVCKVLKVISRRRQSTHTMANRWIGLFDCALTAVGYPEETQHFLRF